jgi:hypothetical protein
LNHCSKELRTTFISNAARIWSQGLIAVTGETANAIVPILACVVLCTSGTVYPPKSGNSFAAAKSAWLFVFSTACRLPECRCSAPETSAGPGTNQPFRETLGNLLERSQD